MSAVARYAASELGAPFQWRTARGEMLPPARMATRHLFNTVSMIWNHSMPDEAVTHRYRMYDFDPVIYTPRYMRTAVAVMLPELFGRRDLTPAMQARLDFMRRYFAKNPDKLTAPVPLLLKPEGL